MDTFEGYKKGGDLVWLFPEEIGDLRYFGSEKAYEAYLEAERAVSKAPLNLEFDWRTLIQILLGRNL
jgi:hypothetical protein